MQLQQPLYNILKIPIGVANQKQNFVIGIIDASGSMQTYWKQMVKFWNQTLAQKSKIVITFDNNAKVQPKSILSQELSKHGGGGTNILKAFQLFQNQIQEFIPEISFTVIFISDGQDTYHRQKLPLQLAKLKGGNGRSINFICLGIQSGFPTKISMALRQRYHKGDQNIPALYLIEYASQKAFFNKFQSMKSCFSSYGQVIIKPSCKQYPWEQQKKIFFQGSWILIPKQLKNIEIFVENELKGVENAILLKQRSIQQLVDCIRGWVQKLQLISLDQKKNKNIQSQAEIAITITNAIIKQYQKQNNLQIISNSNKQLKSFKARAVDLIIKNIGIRLKWYIDQMTILMKGVGTAHLNQFDAAKRIGIGTITGKYHQKALALKGITVNQFAIMKQQFRKIYSAVKLSKQQSKQQVSIFTLQNQKQIFQQEDLIEGLQYCKSQYDLVQTFPIVGYSLKVKRYDGSMINPWKVVVTKLARHHKSIDSVYLAKNQNKFQLKIGEQGIEQINAILPLYDIKDVELSPLLNSRLFRLAVSFMVVQNIDTYHSDAYLALLSNTLVYLLQIQDSQWKTDLLQLIYESIKVTYGQQEWFQKYISQIQGNNFVLFKPLKQFKQQHVDITRVLCLIYYIVKQKRLNKTQVEHLIKLLICHYTQKTFVQNEYKIDRVVSIPTGEIEQQIKVEEQIIENLKDLEKVVDKYVKKTIFSHSQKNIKLTGKIFLKEEKQKQRVTITILSKFMNLINVDLKITQDFLLSCFGHFLNGKTQQNYNKQINTDQKFVKQSIFNHINIQKILSSGQFLKKQKQKIQNLFINKFQQKHFNILPLTKQAFHQLCKQKNLNPKHYFLNYKSGLLRNTCQSKECHLYLKPMKDIELVQHMKLWRNKLPVKFHWKVKQNSELKQASKIYDVLTKTIKFNKYGKDKEFVQKYIQSIVQNLKQ